MKTVTAHATAKLKLHEDVEIEVPENTSDSEVERLLKEQAAIKFSWSVTLNNGLSLDIEVKRDDE